MREVSKIKRIFAFLACIIMCIPLSANASGSMNWYFKPTGDGSRPICFGGNDLPDKYGCIYMGPEEKVVYLTFDAGYENGNVEKTLDILDKHSAKGAFFVLPNLIKSNTELVKRMADEGHLVCNHSYSHKNVSSMSKEQLSEELKKLEEVYKQYIGLEMPKFFRPPEGSFSENTLKYCREMGYSTVFWSFAYADWDNNKQMSPEKAKEKILSNVHDGMVMLLHPTSATNAAVLDDVMTELENRGYRFGTLDEFQAEASVYDKLEEYKQMGLVFSDAPEAGKQMALTFDDGPHPVYTNEILDILAEYDVKATFFVIGKNIKGNEEIIKRILAEGHEIGVHTFSHTPVSKLGKDGLEKEIRMCEQSLEKFGCYPSVFRAPGGELCFDAIEKVNSLGYKYVLWSWRMDTRDWAGSDAEKIKSVVMNNLSGGDVPLFHDYNAGKSHTPEALREILPLLKDKGYTFCTMSQLINIADSVLEPQ